MRLNEHKWKRLTTTTNDGHNELQTIDNEWQWMNTNTNDKNWKRKHIKMKIAMLDIWLEKNKHIGSYFDSRWHGSKEIRYRAALTTTAAKDVHRVYRAANVSDKSALNLTNAACVQHCTSTGILSWSNRAKSIEFCKRRTLDSFAWLHTPAKRIFLIHIEWTWIRITTNDNEWQKNTNDKWKWKTERTKMNNNENTKDHMSTKNTNEHNNECEWQ